MRNQLFTRTTGMIAAAMTTVLILTFAAAMTVSAQADGPDWKQAPTGLTVTAGDQAGELDITWDPNPQTSKTLSDYRVTWTPDGQAFKSNDHTEWYAYPTTNQVSVTGLDAGEAYQVRVRARYDDGRKSSWSDVATGQAAAPTAPTNSAATGQPTITGTAEVGETLTAATSGIADGNGLTNAVFTYQWIRSASGTDTDISGATSSTYVITNADVDNAIKVRVSFTDDDGYSETLTSNATASVPVPAPVIVPPEEPQIAQAAGDDDEPVVLDDWSLKPSGLGVGDQFRLIFLSSTKRNATSSNIGTYNTWIQARAAAGHDDIQAYSNGFTVVGCTHAKDARDNTSTTYTSTDKGVPIYWLNGSQVADEYEDFYDGDWDNESNSRDRNELGTNGTNTSQETNYPLTGCDHDGTEKIQTTGSLTQYRGLGNPFVRIGRLNSSVTGHGPLSGGANDEDDDNRPMYGLSAVFTIVDQLPPITLVSNAGQTLGSQSVSQQSQPFTTGSNLGGYTLNSVKVGLGGTADSRTRLFHIVPNQSNGQPDLSDSTKFITLTTPSSLSSNSLNTFTAPAGAKLAANTTYHLYLASADGGVPGNIQRVSSQDEDDGGAPGWSIGNTRYWRSSGSGPWSINIATIVRMQIIGRNALPSTDAKLSGLTIVGATGGETITLSPAFHEDTLTYTATAAHSIDTVTLSATKNHSGAMIAITDDDDANTKNEADLDLSVGANTLTVTVTAEDTSVTETYTITVTRAQDPTVPPTVLPTWSLIPSGLSNTDDQFRLLFVSAIRRTGSSSDIADYNTFVQEQAAAGHTDIQTYNNRFTAVGCTEAVDARDNTGTTYTSTDKGVPIYWLNGNKVADDYENFYDGDWDDEAASKNELGTASYNISHAGNRPLTGCSDDGTEKVTANDSSALGNGGDITVARPNSSGTGDGPLSSGQKIDKTFTRPMYALSQAFTVTEPADCPTDTTWCATMGVRNTTTTTSLAKYEFSGYNITDRLGTLSSTTFSHESTDYTINRLEQTTFTTLPANTISLRNFYLKADPALPAGTILTLGDRSFTVGDESENPTLGQEEWDTIDNPLNWTNRQDVTVSLTLPATDATLSALTIEGATNGETVDLSPAFDDDTFAYTATVPYRIEAVTLTATKNDDNATVVITNDDDTTTKDEANLDLNVGDTTLTVSVTPKDTFATETYTVTVTRAQGPPATATVTVNWSLKPSSLSVGDEFRLIFLSSTKHNANPDYIVDYNTFVQNLTAVGHIDIQDHSPDFRVVGCTRNIDARDNTGTTGTGVPVYWLSGNKVAADYADFYDGSWDDEANEKDEFGNNGLNTNQSGNYPRTGCDHDGTESFTAGFSRALGVTNPRVARPNSSSATHGPLSSDVSPLKSNTRPMYGLSPVFQVAQPILTQPPD